MALIAVVVAPIGRLAGRRDALEVRRLGAEQVDRLEGRQPCLLLSGQQGEGLVGNPIVRGVGRMVALGCRVGIRVSGLAIVPGRAAGRGDQDGQDKTNANRTERHEPGLSSDEERISREGPRPQT